MRFGRHPCDARARPGRQASTPRRTSCFAAAMAHRGPALSECSCFSQCIDAASSSSGATTSCTRADRLRLPRPHRNLRRSGTRRFAARGADGADDVGADHRRDEAEASLRTGRTRHSAQPTAKSQTATRPIAAAIGRAVHPSDGRHRQVVDDASTVSARRLASAMFAGGVSIPAMRRIQLMSAPAQKLVPVAAQHASRSTRRRRRRRDRTRRVRSSISALVEGVMTSGRLRVIVRADGRPIRFGRSVMFDVLTCGRRRTGVFGDRRVERRRQAEAEHACASRPGR